MPETVEAKMIPAPGECPNCHDEEMFSIVGLPYGGMVIACQCGYVKYFSIQEVKKADESTA